MASACPIPESGPFNGLHQKPGADGTYSVGTAGGNVSTRPLFYPEFRGARAARAIEPVQDVEVGGKKGVAPLKRSHCCFFGIAKPDLHGARIANDGLKVVDYGRGSEVIEPAAKIPALSPAHGNPGNATSSDWRARGHGIGLNMPASVWALGFEPLFAASPLAEALWP